MIIYFNPYLNFYLPLEPIFNFECQQQNQEALFTEFFHYTFCTYRFLFGKDMMTIRIRIKDITCQLMAISSTTVSPQIRSRIGLMTLLLFLHPLLLRFFLRHVKRVMQSYIHRMLLSCYFAFLTILSFFSWKLSKTDYIFCQNVFLYLSIFFIFSTKHVFILNNVSQAHG